MMHKISYIGLFVGLLCVSNGNSCTNKRPDCSDLVKRGLCDTNKQEMTTECPAACSFCETVLFPEEVNNPSNDNQCVDQDSNCKSWARNGTCRTHEMLMRSKCPRSCNFCQQRPQEFRTIAKPEFDCGRPYPVRAENTRNRVLRQTPSQKPQRTSEGSQQGNAKPITPQQQDIKVEDAICGASVIHPRFILTAAHCVLDPTRPVRSVRLGELDFSKENEANSKPADYAIEQIIVHPDFQFGQRYNNVALLQTKTTIEFNEFVYPFCLSSVRPPPHTVVTASGFGKVNTTHQSSVLQEGELSIIDSSECEASYRQKNLEGVLREWYPNLLQGHDAMCAGHPGRGACEGDGGGPLIRPGQDGRRFLVGMVSVAMACKGTEVSKLPGVYVNIADHIDFIDSVVYGF